MLTRGKNDDGPCMLLCCLFWQSVHEKLVKRMLEKAHTMAADACQTALPGNGEDAYTRLDHLYP